MERKFGFERSHTDAHHSDSVPELSFWHQTRAEERIAYGENINFGPGYGQCVEHYYESELGPAAPNNRLLDVMAEKMSLPRDRIVPVIAGSLQSGAYLSDVITPLKVLPLSADLDAVVCTNPEDALKLRRYSPILLPLSATRNVLLHLESGREPGKRQNAQTGRETRDRMRIEFANTLGVPADKLSIHLGSDEIIKSALRGIASTTREEKKPTIFIPIPNYFDAINFSARFGFNVLPDFRTKALKDQDAITHSWAETISKTKPEAVYLSNPNNPLGYTLSLDELRVLLRATPPKTRFMIDEVNINRGVNGQMFSSPWKQLAKEFPNHHIIFIDSLSKSHDLVSERLGFGLATRADDARMLQALEPPRFPATTYQRAGHALFAEPIENQTILKIRYFYERLGQIEQKVGGRISVGPTNSNFCVVLTNDPQLKIAFLKKLQTLDASSIPAKQIVGLPLEGSGELTKDDLNRDGTLKSSIFARKGIIGLPNNAVRLSALNHPIILDALEESL